MRRLLVLLLIPWAVVHAQTPPWAFTPDPAYEYRIGGALPGGMAQGYLYEMVYDSICHVSYLVTECARNGAFVTLEHWEDGRLVHAAAPLLTYNSRSVTFPIAAGDTISLYRELRWYHPITQWQDTNTYYALDTLEYVLHLVRADGTPIAQLDSTGVLPRTTPGVPSIYASRPAMAVVRYVVGPGAGDSAFIGVTVRANGSGTHHFTRLDSYTFGVSGWLQKAFYVNYLAHFSSIYAKRAAGDLSQPGDERYELAVSSAARDVGITWRAPADVHGAVSVVIYDMSGELVFSPATSSAGAGETRYRATPGAYIVALLHGGRVVRTRTVTIN